jgi:hypothetical protein
VEYRLRLFSKLVRHFAAGTEVVGVQGLRGSMVVSTVVVSTGVVSTVVVSTGVVSTVVVSTVVLERKGSWTPPFVHRGSVKPVWNSGRTDIVQLPLRPTTPAPHNNYTLTTAVPTTPCSHDSMFPPRHSLTGILRLRARSGHYAQNEGAIPKHRCAPTTPVPTVE